MEYGFNLYNNNNEYIINLLKYQNNEYIFVFHNFLKLSKINKNLKIKKKYYKLLIILLNISSVKRITYDLFKNSILTLPYIINCITIVYKIINKKNISLKLFWKGDYIGDKIYYDKLVKTLRKIKIDT